ncbi:DUF1269 domain-containing protein [Piscinibacter sakaiensis]|uniref:DUF1269 domain-containing protein n=1 Tax=Piscinibacter sakaiensis TaxID=1547922 RepID=UPI003AAA88D2
MSKRIYWLLPDLDSARKTMNDLLLAQVSVNHIHFLARDGTDLGKLHEANILQTTDVIRSAQYGLTIGAATGAVVGALAAVFFPVVGEDPQWGIAALLAIFGGGFGAWASSMIGISTPSVRLKRFEGAIEQGQILLMVDVPRSRVVEIEELLKVSHPEARLEGVEPDMPAFP